jgi:defect-in-organelle-trafficking protein DotD
MNKQIIIFFFAVLLSGCVSEYIPAPAPASDPAVTKLAEAADSVNHSLETLEGIRKAEMPGYRKKLPNPYAYGLNGEASIDWTGPIGPLVKKIAAISGFRFTQLGSSPSIPIIVAIHKEDTPLGFTLRDADYQAGAKADIFVFPQKRVIELRYRPLTS